MKGKIYEGSTLFLVFLGSLWLVLCVLAALLQPSIDELGLVSELKSGSLFKIFWPFHFEKSHAYLAYAPNQYFSGIFGWISLKLFSPNLHWFAPRVPSLGFTLLLFLVVAKIVDQTWIRWVVALHLSANGFLQWFLISGKGYPALCASALIWLSILKRKELPKYWPASFLFCGMSHSVGAVIVLSTMLLWIQKFRKSLLLAGALSVVLLISIVQHLWFLSFENTGGASARSYLRGLWQVFGVADAWWFRYWMPAAVVCVLGIVLSRSYKLWKLSLSFASVVLVAYMLGAKSLDGRWLLPFLIPAVIAFASDCHKRGVFIRTACVLFLVSPAFNLETVYRTMSWRTACFHQTMLSAQRCVVETRCDCVALSGEPRRVRWATDAYGLQKSDVCPLVLSLGPPMGPTHPCQLPAGLLTSSAKP